MQDLNDLYYFAKVVECGGFAAAGRALGIPKSRLSRRIAELEARLNTTLLQRTTRKLALTAVGERYLVHCQAVLLEAETADETVAALTSEPRGRLRVSCPVGMTRWRLAEVVSDFLARHPLVQLEVLLVNRRVDLIDENVDAALRVRDTGDEDPGLIVRNLMPATAYLVASPSLVHGLELRRPQDLESLPGLGAPEADRRIHFRLLDRAGKPCEIALEPRLSIEDFSIRKQAALDGLGITLLPSLNCNQELAEGSLVRLLPEWSLPAGHVQIAYTRRRGMLPAVRAWIEHVSREFPDGAFLPALYPGEAS